MYPRVVVDINKLRENIIICKNLLDNHNTSMMFVAKCICEDEYIIRAIDDIDFEYLADARLDNFEGFRFSTKRKVLLRIPMLSELEKVIKEVDISMVSEIETIKKMNEIAIENATTHSVILMVELGDLREGVMPDDVLDYARFILSLSNIKLLGLGVNLTCYGSIIPTADKLNKLVELKHLIKSELDYDIEILSGGNSSSMHLYGNNSMPDEINNLRLGEIILLGKETAYGKNILNLNEDVFILEAEIIEAKIKDTKPYGELGRNAFGEKIEYEDLGKRKRAILAIGKQDVDFEDLKPIDERVLIYGASSDHLIIDITDTEYKLGDIIRFKLSYASLLKLFTSKYVKKEYI